jgi:hypothetical protein
MQGQDERIMEFLRHERGRLATFKDWPLEVPHPECLAENGFFYFGQKDAVQCVDCLMIACAWEEKDNPGKEHKKFSPKCPRVKHSHTTIDYPIMVERMYQAKKNTKPCCGGSCLGCNGDENFEAIRYRSQMAHYLITLYSLIALLLTWPPGGDATATSTTMIEGDLMGHTAWMHPTETWKGLMAIKEEEAWIIPQWSTTHWEIDLTPCIKLHSDLENSLTDAQNVAKDLLRKDTDALRINNAKSILEQGNIPQLLQTLHATNQTSVLSTIPAEQASTCTTQVLQFLDAHECKAIEQEVSTYDYLYPAFATPFTATNQKDTLVTMGLTALVNLAERYNQDVEKLAEVLAVFKKGEIPEEAYPFFQQECLNFTRECPARQDSQAPHIAKLWSISHLKIYTTNNKILLTVEVPCVQQRIAKYQLQALPYRQDDRKMTLVLPYDQHIWMEREEDSWQIIADPQQCMRANGIPALLCFQQPHNGPNSPFLARGSNRRIDVPAIELPWKELPKEDRAQPHMVITGNDMIAISNFATFMSIDCSGDRENMSLTIEPLQIVTAKVPNNCELKMKSMTGKIIKEIAPNIVHRIFSPDGPPAILSFQNGTISYTTAVLAHQLGDIFLHTLHDEWPSYGGAFVGIVAFVLLTCCICCNCSANTLTPPAQPAPKKQARQSKRPLYVRAQKAPPLGL